ncbi:MULTISPECIES: host attachment protein [Tepidiphilus]|uniref:host attachment protein n=1 Tax=Tepidiphilus TaxID=203470 RepID=UPI00115C66D9|nr:MULTISPECIES: host attachment protein [Tepidiphilus]
MKKTWVLVANASVAKFYEFLGFKSGVQLIETHEHPESRLPTRELITDNLPFPGTGSDKPPHTGEPPLPPKKVEAARFAIDIARRLREARLEHQLEQIILMGPANFLAMVKEHLDEPTRKILVRDVEKDYTKADDKTIAEKAAEALLPPA